MIPVTSYTRSTMDTRKANMDTEELLQSLPHTQTRNMVAVAYSNPMMTSPQWLEEDTYILQDQATSQAHVTPTSTLHFLDVNASTDIILSVGSSPQTDNICRDVSSTKPQNLTNFFQRYYLGAMQNCQVVVNAVQIVFTLTTLICQPFIQQLQGYKTISMQRWKPTIDTFVIAIPVIMACVTMIMMTVDQGTDIRSSYKVCNIPCRCYWKGDSHSGNCSASYDSLTVNSPCYKPPDKGTNYQEYCFANAKNETECETLSWSPKTSRRHNIFCVTSIGSILLPSIIISTYLFIRLLSIYPSVLGYLGVPDTSYFYKTFKITLVVFYILQLLPYTWLVMNFLIVFKTWRGGSLEGYKEKETMDKLSKKTKIIFCTLEDVPQLILQSMFIINSVLTDDAPQAAAGMYMLDAGSFLGVASSSASIALALTIYRGSSNKKAAFMQFFTIFVSVGTRALVCALYAVIVFKYEPETKKTKARYIPRTWPLLLPSLTAVALYITEYVLILLCIFIKYNVSSLTQTRFVYYISNGTHSVYDRATSYNCNANVIYIRDRTHSAYNWITSKDCNGLIISTKEYVGSKLIHLVALCFDGNSVNSLITSYTYLGYALLINTVYVAETGIPMTRTTLLVLQYVSLSSVLVNLLIVQWGGKHRVRCLAYSIIFLLFVTGIYIWFKNDSGGFNKFFEFFHGPSHHVKQEIETVFKSIIPIFSIAGITTSFNLLVMIIGLIRDC